MNIWGKQEFLWLCAFVFALSVSMGMLGYTLGYAVGKKEGTTRGAQYHYTGQYECAHALDEIICKEEK